MIFETIIRIKMELVPMSNWKNICKEYSMAQNIMLIAATISNTTINIC